jgi:hypothetical protein
LIDAYQHARVLIDKILFHVGYEDADVWKVVISNDEDDAQMVGHSLFLMPFAANAEGQREAVATVFDSTARNNHENAYSRYQCAATFAKLAYPDGPSCARRHPRHGGCC